MKRSNPTDRRVQSNLTTSDFDPSSGPHLPLPDPPDRRGQLTLSTGDSGGTEIGPDSSSSSSLSRRELEKRRAARERKKKRRKAASHEVGVEVLRKTLFSTRAAMNKFLENFPALEDLQILNVSRKKNPTFTSSFFASEDLENFKSVRGNTLLFDVEDEMIVGIVIFKHKAFDGWRDSDWFSLFEGSIRLLPHLSRHLCSTKGKVIGFGQRLAMEKPGQNPDYEYKLARPKNKEEPYLSVQHPDLHQRAKDFVGLLQGIARDFLPKVVEDRKEAMKTLDGRMNLFSEIGPNLYLSKNFASEPHLDHDVEDLYAFGLFAEQHQKGCERTRCTHLWDFFFPKHGIRVNLTTPVAVLWNSARYHHGTAYEEEREGCSSVVWGASSQIKGNFFNKFLSS